MNQNSVTVVATLQAKPGKEAALKQELLALIPPTRAEAGCLNYDLHQSVDHPAHFLFHENWTSKAALDAHLAQPYLTALLAKVPELLTVPPEIRLWNRIG